MTLSKMVFKPGINRDQTNYASEGGWFDCDKIRFRSGFPEKIGGWVIQNFQSYIGTARSSFSYTTSDGTQIIAIGTNEKIYVAVGTAIYDITPIRASFTTPASDNCIETVNTEAKVIVNITGHGCGVGDWVTISGVVGTGVPQKINNIPITEINGEHKITAVTANSFTIATTTAANASSASNGGTAITVDCQLNIGNAIVTEGYGWGTGQWAAGPGAGVTAATLARTWGSSGTPGITLPVRMQFFQNFNNDLMFNVRNGEIYYWTYTTAFSGRAVLLSSFGTAVDVPTEVGRILFASSGHLFALGSTEPNGIIYDPLLVRWANVDADIGPEPENWEPLLTNTAGFFRLQSGSEIITGINTRQETLVWTNTSLYSLQFLGTSEVFGQQPLSAHISILGPNVVTGANNVTYWMGNDKFYSYSGRVDTLPCTLRQYVFTNINRTQGVIFFAGTNAQFNEVVWFYCSKNSSSIDRYVIYNYAENIWYFGQLARTTWVDAGNTRFPIATNDGWIYQHENGTDDGQPNGEPPLPITSYIQSADVDIGDGEQFMLTKRVIPDVNFTGSEAANPVTGDPITPEAYITVGVRNFPGAANSETNASGLSTIRDVVTTATIDQYTNQVFVRARGRQMNFKIGSDTVGTQWQLGMPRLDAKPDGRRG